MSFSSQNIKLCSALFNNSAAET